MVKKKVLVLSVDYDDDLYEKAKIRAPVIGRHDNLKAAQELAISDPQDSDANTMFQAIKTCDELNKEKNIEAEIATITGNKKLGFKADTELANQLENVLTEVKPDSCIFVGDGASDEQIIPVIQSRIKIDSVKTVTIKQAKELEKTYFVILEKLKDPHYARPILGIPGLLLLSFFIFNLTGLRYALGLIGIYLIIKGFGVEEKIITYVKDIANIKNISSLFTIASIPLMLIGIILGISTLVVSLSTKPIYTSIGEALTESVGLIALGIMIIITGKIIESIRDNKKITIFDYANKIVIIILAWLNIYDLGGWLIGKTSFGVLINTVFLTILTITCTTFLFSRLKENAFKEFALIGKDIFNKHGHYIGKIAVQTKELVEIKNHSGKYLKLPLEKLDFEGSTLIAKI